MPKGLAQRLLSANRPSRRHCAIIPSAESVQSLGSSSGKSVPRCFVILRSVAARVGASGLSRTFSPRSSRVEVALDKSIACCDGQLAYYAAQAREIIDCSMNSQKQIVEELRQLPGMPTDEGGFPTALLAVTSIGVQF
jgi:hypothetical protein